MEAWRKVWREGMAPLLSTAGLEALRQALLTDDARLLQGATTSPPPLQCVQDWPVEAACAIGFCGVPDAGGFAPAGEQQPVESYGASGKIYLPVVGPYATVADVEKFFARVCSEADQRLGELAACRWFLNWYDDTPRAEVFRLLTPEVERELERREAVGESCGP